MFDEEGESLRKELDIYEDLLNIISYVETDLKPVRQDPRYPL